MTANLAPVGAALVSIVVSDARLRRILQGATGEAQVAADLSGDAPHARRCRELLHLLAVIETEAAAIEGQR